MRSVSGERGGGHGGGGASSFLRKKEDFEFEDDTALEDIFNLFSFRLIEDDEVRGEGVKG
jgi:hypothetical protein